MVAKVGALLAVLVLAAVLAGAAKTAPTDVADVELTDDTYAALTAQAATYGLAETLSVAAGGLGTCAATEITYLKFDLSGVRQAVMGSATLELQATYASSANSGTLVLYAVADVEADGVTPWQASTVTWLQRPAVSGAAVLATVPAPPATGTVTFASQALAEAINEESAYTGEGDTTAGDDVLSLAVQLEACTGLLSVVRFAAAEHSSAPPPALVLVRTTTVWLPLLP